MRNSQAHAIKQAKEALWQHAVPFATANRDLHFMISHKAQRIDFWPTTGRWLAHGFRDVPGRGLPALLSYIEKN